MTSDDGTGSGRDARLRRRWDREASGYDRAFAAAERRMFPDARRWLCGRASGRTLEVALGTGLNLEHYPRQVLSGGFTGVEWSAGMLDVARRRAARLGLDLGLGLELDPETDLRLGDAQALDLPDDAFDTVVCTFSLCAIPDDRAALAEMVRVLRPGGHLLLADHVVSSSWPLRALQAVADLVSVPLAGEHFRRRPLLWVREHGLVVEEHERTRAGVVELVVARAG